MSKYVDLDTVANSLIKKAYKLSDVKDKLIKVAFDIVRFADNPEQLWQIQQADDGEFIVALYSEDEEKVATASASSNWKVIVKNAELNIFYKDNFVHKIGAEKLGFEPSDLVLAKQYLPTKLTQDTSFVKALMKDVDETTKKQLVAKYPELAQ
jgi:hypothetical protein